jgi:beta-lactamase regulating signal transducer with metallopeptidase domain
MPGLFFDSAALAGGLWVVAWQSSFWLAAGLIVSRLWRRRPARAHLAVTVALAAAVATPLLTLAAGSLQLGLLPPREVGAMPASLESKVIRFGPDGDRPEMRPAVSSDADGLMAERAGAVRTAAGPRPRTGIEDAASWTEPTIPGFQPVILLAIWLTGAFAGAARMLHSLVGGMRLVRRAAPVHDGALQASLGHAARRFGIPPPRLARSPVCRCPMIWCWGRPVVLVPDDASPDASLAWEAVFSHELAHLVRRDHLADLTGDMAATLLWWNPLAWLGRRQMRTLAEEACDDWALNSGGDPLDYANSLLALAPQPPAAMFAAVTLRSSLATRVTRILSDRVVRPELGRRFGFAVAAGALLVACGAAVAQRNEAAKETPATPSEPDASAGTDAAETVLLEGVVVDGAGRPVPRAVVRVESPLYVGDAMKQMTVAADDAGVFSLDTGVPTTSPPGAIRSLRVSATSPDQSLIGLYRVPEGDSAPESGAIRIVAEPARRARVRVVDGEGRPVAGATVAFQLGFPLNFGPVLTAADGQVSVALPQSETVEAVVAWKDHQGLDYKLYTLPWDQAGDRLTKRARFPDEPGETLVLDGAAPFSVQIRDFKGEPILAAHAQVWLLEKPGRQDQLNLSLLPAMDQRSDEHGLVPFAWFPAWQTTVTTVWSGAKGFVEGRTEYEPGRDAQTLAVQLERFVTLRGSVRFADGRPAAGINVVAHGAGHSMDSFHRGVPTDETGRYELPVAPLQVYMLTIADKQWSAPAASGFVVLPESAVEDHDFTLHPATRVHGRVLNKATSEPVAGQHIYFTQKGTPLHELGADLLPNPEGSKIWVCPTYQQSITTDVDGEFEFFAGEGTYELAVEMVPGKKVMVGGEPEIGIDLEIPVKGRKTLTGTVVRGDTRETVAAARVTFFGKGALSIGTAKAATAEDGRFEVEVFSEPALVHVSSGDDTAGGIVAVEAAETSLTVPLSPLGSARGRLLTEDGSQPAARVRLSYGVPVSLGDPRFSTTGFGGEVRTDAKGEFTLPKLVPGWNYVCTTEDVRNGSILTVANATVEPGETKQLGDVRVPTTPTR